jgi:hypothetical protein
MVDSGSSLEKILEELFEGFSSRLAENEIDEKPTKIRL